MNSPCVLVASLCFLPVVESARALDVSSANEAAGTQDGVAPSAAELRALTLDRALEIALVNNLDIQLESLAAEISFYAMRSSYGVFDWSLGGRAGLSDAEFQPTDVFGGSTRSTNEYSLSVSRFFDIGGTLRAGVDSITTETDSSFSVAPTSSTEVLALSYTQPLLRGAWREYGTSNQRIAELAYKRSDERQREVRHRLLLDVSNAYWDLVAARQELEVANSNVDLAKQEVAQSQKKLDAGVSTEINVIQAQAEVARREQTQLLLDVRVKAASDKLKQILFPGRDPAIWEAVLEPGTPLPVTVTADAAPNWEVALSVAIDRRSELRQQRIAIDEAVVTHQRSRSERKPGLDFEVSATGQGFSGDLGDALDTAGTFDYPTYRAALVFNYPLSNTAASANERAAWASLRAERIAYDQLEARIVGEVRSAVRDVVYQAEAVKAAQKSVELAERQLNAERARLEQDMSTNFQVLQFQQDFALARFSESAARANYAKSLAVLAAAQGLLGEPTGP